MDMLPFTISAYPNFNRNSNESFLDLVTNFHHAVPDSSENIIPVDQNYTPLFITFSAVLATLKNRQKIKTGNNKLVIFEQFCDIELAFIKLYDKFYQIIKIFVPLLRTSTHQYPQWFNSDVIRTIKKTHNLFIQY